MAIMFVGADLAKKVLAVHGINLAGQGVLVGTTVARAKLAEMIAKLPPGTIGVEGSTSSQC